MPVLICALRPRLEEENEMEWKGIKRIILEYSFLPLFRSFIEGMENSFPCLGV